MFMKELYTQKEFDDARATHLLPFQCYICDETFFYEKRWVVQAINEEHRRQIKYCSKKCQSIGQISKIKCVCKNCGGETQKTPSQIKKAKNVFCSRSCAATYNNKNKTHGTRRSKLEVWLEKQLNQLYPNLDIKFNDKETIGSELDIYIPSLNVAFELNGIFHYEPIYGNDKLQQIQENDQSKSKACHDLEIDLCVIDTSQQKYFKPKTSKKYLDIITNIINQRTLLNS